MHPLKTLKLFFNTADRKSILFSLIYVAALICNRLRAKSLTDTVGFMEGRVVDPRK